MHGIPVVAFELQSQINGIAGLSSAGGRYRANSSFACLIAHFDTRRTRSLYNNTFSVGVLIFY